MHKSHHVFFRTMWHLERGGRRDGQGGEGGGRGVTRTEELERKVTHTGKRKGEIRQSES